MERLHKLDEVAYVRFASVYRSFKDINEFMSELKDILSSKEMKDAEGQHLKFGLRISDCGFSSQDRSAYPSEVCTSLFAPPPAATRAVNPQSESDDLTSVVDIAVGVSVNKTFHYRAPGRDAGSVLSRDRACSCPSAAGRIDRHGRSVSRTSAEVAGLKSVIDILDNPLTPELLALARWMADYYLLSARPDHRGRGAEGRVPRKTEKEKISAACRRRPRYRRCPRAEAEGAVCCLLCERQVDMPWTS